MNENIKNILKDFDPEEHVFEFINVTKTENGGFEWSVDWSENSAIIIQDIDAYAEMYSMDKFYDDTGSLPEGIELAKVEYLANIHDRLTDLVDVFKDMNRKLQMIAVNCGD